MFRRLLEYLADDEAFALALVLSLLLGFNIGLTLGVLDRLG